MSRTRKPLTIYVHPDLAHTDEVRELAEAGHTITVGEPLKQYDMVMGPNCWRMQRELLVYLDLAVEAGQGDRYPKTDEAPKRKRTKKEDADAR